MVDNSNTPIFHRTKPVFGLDIGASSVKIMEINQKGKKPMITGYGYTVFDPKAIKNGVIVDHELLAKSIYELVTKNMVGKVSTNNVDAIKIIVMTLGSPLRSFFSWY